MSIGKRLARLERIAKCLGVVSLPDVEGARRRLYLLLTRALNHSAEHPEAPKEGGELTDVQRRFVDRLMTCSGRNR